MNWLDTAILAVLGLAAFFGARSGFVGQVARLLTLGLAIYGTLRLNAWATSLLAEAVLAGASPWLVRVTAYAAVFLIIYVVLHTITLFLERGVKAAQMQGLNRILGAFLGAAKAALILGAIFLGLTTFAPEASQVPLEQSSLAPVLRNGADRLFQAIPVEYRDGFWAQLRQLDVLEETEPAAEEASED
jgi:uncharacterized membrane protein required for colicin V production